MMLRSLHAMADVFVVVAVLADVGGRGQIAAYQRMCIDGRKPTAIVIPTNGRIPIDVYHGLIPTATLTAVYIRS